MNTTLNIAAQLHLIKLKFENYTFITLLTTLVTQCSSVRLMNETGVRSHFAVIAKVS